MDSVQLNSEQFTSRESAYQQLRYVTALLKAARVAVSLAKEAKTPEVMRAEAEKAISRYEEYKFHFICWQPDIEVELEQAEQLAALAQRELDKPLIQRWIEDHWEFIITG